MNIFTSASKNDVMTSAHEWQAQLTVKQGKNVSIDEALNYLFWHDLKDFVIPTIILIIGWFMAYVTYELHDDGSVANTLIGTPFFFVSLSFFSMLLTINRFIYAYRLKIIASLKSNQSGN